MLGRFFRAYFDAFRGPPQAVWLVSFVLLVNRSGTMVLPFWALYCTSERSLRPSDAGVLLAIYGMGGILGSYLGGWLTNRLGAMRVVSGSMALTGIGFLFLMGARSWNEMVASMLLLSVVAESFRPAAASATAELCPPHLHSRAFALNRLAINLGMSVGATVGGFLAEIGFRWLFIFDAVTCFGAAALSLAISGHGALKPVKKAVASDPPTASPWRDMPFLVTVVLMLLTATVFFQMLSTYVLYMRDYYGLKESRIGILFAVNTVVIVFLEMGLVRLIERFNKLRVLAWGCLFSCVGFGIIQYGVPLHLGFSFCVISVLVWTLGEMLSSPVAMAFVSGRASDANRGTFLGIFTMCFSAAAVLAPLLGTWLYERDPNLVWNGCTAIGLFCFAGFWLLAKVTEGREQRTTPVSSAR